jgi:hypothetical protein
MRAHMGRYAVQANSSIYNEKPLVGGGRVFGTIFAGS